MTETAINTKGGGSTIAICTIIPNDSESQMKFEYIFNSYAKQMIYVANRILGNRQDAEDAAQEALLRIAANIKSVDTTDDARARGYVLTAAKNAARNGCCDKDSPECSHVSSVAHPPRRRQARNAYAKISPQDFSNTENGCNCTLRRQPILR